MIPDTAETLPDSRPTLVSDKPCRVLFLDDEQAVLDGLARQLRNPPAPWRFEFAADPGEALQRVITRRYDIVVSDMCMPGVRGDEWLKQVHAVSPDTIRIALSGRDDRATTLSALNGGHVFYFLTKPCLRGELLRVLDLARRQSEIALAERDMLRGKLEHAERIATVGQFAAGILHDLNNFLGVVLNASHPRSGLAGSEALDLIHANARRMSELTGDLVAFCRRDERGELHPVDIGEVIRSATRLLGPLLPPTVELRIEIADALPHIQGRATELKQVLTNLVLNARDAMPAGGPIHVSAELCATVARNGRGDEPLVCLSVADEGSGMDESTRRRLFEPFFTTKPEGAGTGLGLALVKQIVDRHNGRIQVDSVAGIGTTFRIFLPTATPPPRAIAAGEAAAR